MASAGHERLLQIRVGAVGRNRHQRPEAHRSRGSHLRTTHSPVRSRLIGGYTPPGIPGIGLADDKAWMRQPCTPDYVDGSSTSYGLRDGWDCRGLRNKACLVSRPAGLSLAPGPAARAARPLRNPAT